MSKLLYITFLILFSALGHSATFNFQPTPGDVSIQFLGNIFGVVDGVLHGNNQLFGIIMGVFNSMVLAIGGVVITYTLIVSTLNTAKDGKMLGEKFNSMWVPLRSVIGLGLLVPKLSGYCALQVLIMWITVQGVGAADRLWEATLSYLNRGGRIVAEIQKAADPTKPGDYNQIKLATVATTMLSGQVCMLGIQKILQQTQSQLQMQKNSSLGGGICDKNPADQPAICYSAVPSFLDSVNMIDYQSSHGPESTSPQYNLQMPNFKDDSPYASINGICGVLNWDSLEKTYPKLTAKNMSDIHLNASEQQATMLARVIAMQQMYNELTPLAYSMVDNALAAKKGEKNFSVVAKNQFGVPWNPESNSICTSATGCTSWQGVVGDSGFSEAPIFTGTELQLAMNDYNTIIAPSLNLQTQMADLDMMKKIRSFIATAESKGWVMAGSYFYNIVRLGGSSASSQLGESAGNVYDLDIYENSKNNNNFVNTGISLLYTDNGNCSGNYSSLCSWIGQDGYEYMQLLSTLIRADQFSQQHLPSWDSATEAYKKGSDGTQDAPVSGKASSTVLGYVNNSFMLNLPGQVIEKPKFAMVFANATYDTSSYKTDKDVECYRMKLVWFCLGKVLGKVFWFLVGAIIDIIEKILAELVKLFLKELLTYPLIQTYNQLDESIKMLLQPNVNPMVAIALTGNKMINMAINLFLNQISFMISRVLFSFGVGVIIMGIIGVVVLPVNFALISVFTALGVTAAFYIPLIPYMIFIFGAMGWMIAVVEAMVAAPLVALGISHPDGHDAFGKSEQAVSIILNVFLRPGLMIIGYIAGNILSYVFAWLVATGYSQATNFMTGTKRDTGVTTIYSDYGSIFASFMVIITYMSMYTTAVQKAFSLIYHLPDKVIRWIGGHQESYGEEAMRSVESLKEPIQKSYEGISGGISKGVGEAHGQMVERKKDLRQEEKNKQPKAEGGGEAAGGAGGAAAGGGGG